VLFRSISNAVNTKLRKLGYISKDKQGSFWSGEKPDLKLVRKVLKMINTKKPKSLSGSVESIAYHFGYDPDEPKLATTPITGITIDGEAKGDFLEFPHHDLGRGADSSGHQVAKFFLADTENVTPVETFVKDNEEAVVKYLVEELGYEIWKVERTRIQ